MKDNRNFGDLLTKCAGNYHITATMNPAKEGELDHILAGADYTEYDEASEQPGPSPELTGAVTTPTMDAVSAEGMAPLEWRKGVTEGKAGRRWLLPGAFSFSLTMTLKWR